MRDRDKEAEMDVVLTPHSSFPSSTSPAGEEHGLVVRSDDDDLLPSLHGPGPESEGGRGEAHHGVAPVLEGSPGL